MPDNNISSNKRIAKNTLLLYARMLYSLVISLFTARVVLNALGAVDYGIYNVVGSVVSMFVFLRTAMGNSTHRYVAFALGKGDQQQLNKVFSTSIIIHFAIGIAIIVLAETVGLWFLYNKMVIPEERMVAAQWCYHFSVITCFLSVICVPYDAEIIAHEKMGVFAFVQMFNSTMNLVIAYLLVITNSDRLILYGLLLLSIQVLNRVFYGFYCSRKFEECHFTWMKDMSLIKEMTSFAGWSLIGNMIWVAYTQGTNILLNMFFGPVVNAARGIAVQVQSVIKGFVTNFQMAVNPQITKTYAAGELKQMHSLIFSSTKLSFFLLFMFFLPLFIEAEWILEIWLKNVPDHSVAYLRLSLLIMLFSPLVNPIETSNNATGDIKKFQIVVGCFNIFIVILSYVALKLGFPPESVFVVQLAISSIVLFVKLLLVRKKINLSIREYVVKVLLRLALVALISSVVPLSLFYLLGQTVMNNLLIIVVSVLCVVISAYYVGLSNHERTIITEKIRERIKINKSK